jgi:solute:Na+ symporter, SSS family
MIPTLVVIAYLAFVFWLGAFAFRGRGTQGAEAYLLASRSIGMVVFVGALFATNMTAFTILGAPGHAFHNGIVTFGLMASSSALLLPLMFYLIGTRIWALGKRHGFMTPVQMFRDRWECNHIGTAIFGVQTALLIPYIMIGVMGGGTVLVVISGGLVPYAWGAALVALVVMAYVFLGGMRGTAIVNTFQAAVFLSLGAVAVIVVGSAMGGFGASMQAISESQELSPLLARDRTSQAAFFSYMFIPLATIAMPHICMICLTAKRMSHFKPTVILYPICITAIWLPMVFLGVVANRATEVPEIRAKVEARETLAREGATLAPAEQARLRAATVADDVVVRLLEFYAPLWLVGILGAGILAAVMSSTDSQILGLSTMFTEDLLAHYGGKAYLSEAAQVLAARTFVVVMTIVAYGFALVVPEAIFGLITQYGFSGFSTLAVLLVAALFWRRSTKWGALAVTVWTAVTVVGITLFQQIVPAPAGPPVAVLEIGGLAILERTGGGTSVLGFMPVVPMFIVAVVLMVVVSLLTKAPSAETIERHIPSRRTEPIAV